MRLDSGVAQSVERDPHKSVVAGSSPAPATKSSVYDLAAKYGLATASSLLTDPDSAKPKVYVPAIDPVEIPICGKTWWEDGERYECLMDAGHKSPKCGQRGMVSRMEE